MIVEYFDFRDDMELTCRRCGWTGLGKDTLLEWSSENTPILDRECPKCFGIVVCLPFPTFEQTRKAAEAGNEEAIRMCRTQAIEFNPPPRRPH